MKKCEGHAIPADAAACPRCQNYRVAVDHREETACHVCQESHRPEIKEKMRLIRDLLDELEVLV